ncbi:hypothetical protein ZIOFF_041564 [Zingiber officinale]|uniref:Protein kinase domain-containing protein n=1 Tax=Zingiber officinale TaxID=94328 RepID=A0A8J5G7S8_ZINOF|nr:hypothetical protein ZIOFF_041564 [Zingiber officinale]
MLTTEKEELSSKVDSLVDDISSHNDKLLQMKQQMHHLHLERAKLFMEIEESNQAKSAIRHGGKVMNLDHVISTFSCPSFLLRIANASSLVWWKLVSRTVEIFAALGAFAFKLLLDQRQGQFDQRKRQRAAELTKTLTQLGPTFVKIGQGLSTRPDICPPEYLDELSELQDALPTFPDETAFACIESELGVSLDSIYSAISPEPIAAASLGQVYKAQLKQTGQFVAVKVQRPGIEEAIGLDFYLLRGLGFLVNKYVDFISSDVVALIDEFAKREGKNARRFRKLYADKEEVYVPDIYWDYTSAKVLTMDWVDGVKLNEQEAIEKRGLKMLNLVDIGIQCSLRQLLEYGYFHADPHPGNLLATPEGKLAFIDFGMMSETPEEARSAIIGHVVHMVNRDYNAMARDYYALNFLTPDVDVSPIVPALKDFFDGALNSTVSELNFKTIVDGLGNVLYQYPFNVPAYYALILRSLTVLEGLALYADPNFKVLAASYPYFAKRLLTDPNPYLRDALIELLENLLVQGQKDRDYTTKDALQPVLKLLLGPDGEELRVLVVQEAVRVPLDFNSKFSGAVAEHIVLQELYKAVMGFGILNGISIDDKTGNHSLYCLLGDYLNQMFSDDKHNTKEVQVLISYFHFVKDDETEPLIRVEAGSAINSNGSIYFEERPCQLIPRLCSITPSFDPKTSYDLLELVLDFSSFLSSRGAFVRLYALF